VAALGESPATSMRAVRPPFDPTTMVLVVSGSIRRTEIPALCSRAKALLQTDDVEDVVCDVTALADSSAVAVDVLARLQLTARRCGHRIRLRGARPELMDLLAFVGLAEVVPSLPVEGERKPEQRKEPLRVEEEADPPDLSP
jgi:ABC-type transporter Mla MlaB component